MGVGMKKRQTREIKFDWIKWTVSVLIRATKWAGRGSRTFKSRIPPTPSPSFSRRELGWSPQLFFMEPPGAQPPGPLSARVLTSCLLYLLCNMSPSPCVRHQPGDLIPVSIHSIGFFMWLGALELNWDYPDESHVSDSTERAEAGQHLWHEDAVNLTGAKIMRLF